MSDSAITAASDIGDGREPSDWTVADLRERLDRLQVGLTDVPSRAKDRLRQLQDWATGLPAHHQPEPEPVRLADLASTERERPLSLARRVDELGRLLERVDQLSQTLVAVAADETGLFAANSAENAPLDEAGELAHAEDSTPTRISLIGHCHSAWDDDQSFERQRQAIRRVLTFDGNRTWHGTLARSINDDLAGWNSLLTAAEAGAHVEIDLP